METNHLLPASWVISDLGSKMKGRKFMCDLNNLRCLYLDMKKEGQTAVTFQCKYNNRYCFSCIFIADEDGKVLYISSLGDNSFTLKVHVKSDFSIDKFGLDKETYVKLCEYLELKYNPDNPFIPREFIIQLDGVFPKNIKRQKQGNAFVLSVRQIIRMKEIKFILQDGDIGHKSIRRMIIWKRVQCWSDLEMLCGFKKIILVLVGQLIRMKKIYLS